jgi:hypothetical protein
VARLMDQIQGQAGALDQLFKMRVQKREPSALLFVGPPGVGKTSAAWGYVQDTLCSDPADNKACGVCASCAKVASHSHEAVLLIQSESHSIKLENLERLASFLSLQTPSVWQFVLIKEADKLNLQAGNMLLKSLEEPPEKTTFILVTDHPSRLLVTLKSRCQMVKFLPLTAQQLKALRPGAQEWMIRASQGRLDVLDAWLSEDSDAGRSDLAQLFFQWWQGTDLSLRDFEEYTKDRIQFIKLLEFWQQLVRDGLFYMQGSSGLLHPDFLSYWQQSPASVPEQRPHMLFEVLAQALSDVESNVDRSLIMENLIYASRSLDHPQLVL